MSRYPSKLVDELPTALRGWREAAGLSQRDLAERMQVVQQRVSMIERGIDRSYVSVERYAAALDLVMTVTIREMLPPPPVEVLAPPLEERRPTRVEHPVELVQRFLDNGSRA